MEGKKFNIDIDHSGEAFFAMDFAVSFNQLKFTLDFTQTIQRIDPLPDRMKQSFSIKHKTILMDPMVAKNLAKVLLDMVERYEAKFGKLKAPKTKKKKSKKSKTKSDTDVASGNVYIG